MKLSRQATIRRILSAFRARGWGQPGDVAVAIVDAMVEAGGSFEATVAKVVPRTFLDANGSTREEVAAELERSLAGVEVDSVVVPAHEATPRLSILFLAANPEDQAHLRLDQEARDIEQRLRATDHRDVIDFRSRWAVRPSDLIDALNQERPQVVHFSGHGSMNDELVFEDERGDTKTVARDAIASTIRTVSEEVRLIVFNNCYSEAVAREVALEVEAAVGMGDAVSDPAARIFAAQFYASLGYGRSVQIAFDQAIAALKLEGNDEDEIPKLFTRADVDARAFVLVAGA